MVRSTRHCHAGVLFAMALLATPQTASAEQRSGTHIDTPPPAEISQGLSPADNARATMLAFGACVVQSRRAGVERALAISPLDDRYKRELRNLATNDCLRAGEIRFDFLLMRGSLFAALYRIDFRAGPGALAAEPIDFAADLHGADSGDARDYLGLHQFADCVVRADPAAARALVMAPVAGRTEATAFATLGPRFSACIQQGQNIRFTRIVLTSLIAEALYRESKAAKP